MKEGGEPEPKRRCGRKVLDIFTWLQCFGICQYLGHAVTNLNPRVHDRKHAALKKDTKWSVINTTIYARCVTGAPRNPVKCGVCASTTHDTQDCVEGLSSSMSIEQRMELMER